MVTAENYGNDLFGGALVIFTHTTKNTSDPNFFFYITKQILNKLETNFQASKHYIY